MFRVVFLLSICYEAALRLCYEFCFMGPEIDRLVFFVLWLLNLSSRFDKHGANSNKLSLYLGELYLFFDFNYGLFIPLV